MKMKRKENVEKAEEEEKEGNCLYWSFYNEEEK